MNIKLRFPFAGAGASENKRFLNEFERGVADCRGIYVTSIFENAALGNDPNAAISHINSAINLICCRIYIILAAKNQ